LFGVATVGKSIWNMVLWLYCRNWGNCRNVVGEVATVEVTAPVGRRATILKNTIDSNKADG